MRILVVEDEAKVAEDIARALSSSGYVPEISDEGEDAWFRGETEDYSAVILDLGLPKLDGISILKRWRSAGVATPVLILTARGSWSERVEGIDAGADDYLSKPFQIEELLARLRAVLRRTAGHAASVIEVREVLFDSRKMQISVNGAPIALSPLEYRAVAYLIHHRGRVVPQHELAEHIYGGDCDRDNNTLEVLIGRLRKKIGVSLIETRRGYGYLVSDEGGNEAPSA
ncbi:MAG: response regulator transcription factor [Alphaproteobacteria bacterium]|nr:response regulator transcription factor [Alphaproteobacteria bacterium]